MIADTIGALRSRVLLKVLFDPGSTVTFISRKVLPRHCKLVPIKQGKKVNTIAGSNLCNKMVVLRDIRLPELDKNRWVHQHKALVFGHDTRYNVIFGTDFLTKTGIDVKYSTGTIQWFDNELPMRDPLSMDNSEFVAMTDVVKQECLEELYGMDWYDPTCYAMEIPDAKYEAISTDEVVDQCTHLDDEQKADLKLVLRGFQKLFLP